MPITLDRMPKDLYPFGVFHTTLGSTLCTESELKSDLPVGVLSSSDEKYHSYQLHEEYNFLSSIDIELI